jgi:drug/metabolite transporter (DMT)-like permease
MTAIVKDPAAPPATETVWLSLMPGLFVVLWSTGFIGAKFGLPYAEPLTFLALRFGIVAGLMLAVSLATGAAWPRTWRTAGHSAVVGLLIQAVYLGGVYYGIAHGISAGLSALIVGLQPVLTAAVARSVLGETVAPRQWLGVALGFAGVILVVWSKLAFDAGHLAAFLTTALALLGMTAGTLYQKRFCPVIDLRSATFIQNLAAGLAVLGLALCLETMHITWRIEFVAALTWLCLVLSVVTMMLFLFILRRGAAARIASLFYLVPPVTAFMAYLLFGETLGATALVGMAFTAVGVALVNRG